MGFLNTLTPGCYGFGEQDEEEDFIDEDDGFDDWGSEVDDEQDKLEE